MNRLIALAAFSITTAVAVAPSMLSAQTHQPYAGLETRPIKALSDDQIADLRAGRGMGLALPAELNGYPGPIHVLELAQPLELSPEQQSRVQRLFDAMKAETVLLGAKLIALESELDRQFSARVITEASLTSASQEIGSTHAALRTAHLKYHLATTDVLTSVQVRRYAELRGYSEGAHTGHNPNAHKH